MSRLLTHVFEPGFFYSSPVRTAIIVGALAGLVSAAIGVFTVVRGQSFAGEALADIGVTGGSGAFLVGVGPLWGFLVIGLIAAAAMELIGVQRPRGRDLATGIVLGAGLGLAALFLYLGTTYQSTTGAAVTILFGSVFAISGSTTALAVVLALAVLGILLVVHRSLLLSSVSAEMAAARGIPVRAIGFAYLLALSLAISLCALTIGAILSTALLVGPAAAAVRITKRPGMAILAAGMLGVAAMWLGILLAYDSYYWPPTGRGWPVSFFVVSIVFVVYLLSGLPAWRASRRARGSGSRPAAASGIELEA